MNAPMIGARWARSASVANPSAIANATATSVPEPRARRATPPSSRGTTRRPTTPVTSKKATANPVVPATETTENPPPVASLATTVKMINPRTSSTTAAPRTTRASLVPRAPRSPNTRAVMPTLVAVSAAPMNTAVVVLCPRAMAAAAPTANGTTTPPTATSIDERPTLMSSPTSISMPTPSSNRSTPSSANTASESVRSTRPRTDGPTSIPATISPSTVGILSRSANSAAAFAANKTTRTSKSTAPISRDEVVASIKDQEAASRSDATVAQPSSSIHPRRRTVRIAAGPSARRSVTITASMRRSLRSHSPARRASSNRLITRPGVSTMTASTARSEPPSRLGTGATPETTEGGAVPSGMATTIRNGCFPLMEAL